METQSRSKIHPLVATAAVAVILLCAVAVAAITGYLPGSSAQKAATEPAAAITAPAATPAAPAPKAQPAQPKVAQASPPKQQPAATAAPAPRAAPVAAAQVAAAPPKAVCTNCGTVTGVSEVEVKGEGSGLGAVAGGVAGAVLGSQVGSGGTRTAAGVAGAAGGAYAGHQIEKHMKTKKKYDVGVKMEDGSLRTISFEAPPTWRAGDRVRIVDGKLELAN